MDRDRPSLTTQEALTRGLGPIAGLDAVDVGAGSGAASRALAGLGARVIGIEPNPTARAEADAQGGGPRYQDGTGEATGLASASADLVLFSMSLHHCADMPAALREAIRLLRPDGRLAVLEPEPHDPMAPLMRFIDDETEAYLLAQSALDATLTEGALRPRQTHHHAGRHATETVDDFTADLVFVDSGRSLAPEDYPAVQAAYADAQRRDAEGGYLPYWLRLDIMRRI